MIYADNFEWDSQNLEHISRHGVNDFEVEHVILYDKARLKQGRGGTYCVFGTTEEGRYLFIVIAAKGGGVVRVVTARDMSYKERRYYKKVR
jgi:uncharacterized protein